MPAIVKRPGALADLGEFWSFIADDSIVNAGAFAARIDETFQLLARQPRRGRLRPELGDDIRSFVVDRYVIFYQPLADALKSSVCRTAQGT